MTIFIACNKDESKVKIITERNDLPLETGKNVHITYTDSGYNKAKVFAPLLQRYVTEERNETVMKQGVTVYFYNKNQKVDSYLKSKYAIRYDREKRMIARNDVILVNNKGDSLSTEELIWDEVHQRIYSDKFVRIITPQGVSMGDGFESNMEFTKYKILKYRGTWEIE